MSTSKVPVEVYPFASADGQSIPYDVMRPSGLLVAQYGISDWSTFSVPAASTLGNFFSDSPCLVSFEATPPSDLYGYNTDLMLVPAGTMVQCQLPSPTFWVLGLDTASILYVQSVIRWAALALPRQFIRR